MKQSVLRDGMVDRLDSNACDELLRPLLSDIDGASAEDHLSFLIESHAVPIVIGILKHKLGAWGKLDCFEDLRNDVILRLLIRLRQFKQNPDKYSIWNFREYVVVTTDRVCVNYLRSRFPNRSRLRNTLMYLLTRDSTFFVKEVESGQKICGLSEWLKSDPPMDLVPNSTIFSNPQTIREKVKTEYQDAPSLRMALKEIFAISEGPLQTDEVMKVIGVIFNVQDGFHEGKSEAIADVFDNITDRRADVEKSVETIQYLQKIWKEIQKLPVKQRSALLLNLKDSEGKDLLSIFPVYGIATFREIASILELSLDEFATIWKEIPLGDLKIAELLGVTRQQVINLRKSARERLIRSS